MKARAYRCDFIHAAMSSATEGSVNCASTASNWPEVSCLTAASAWLVAVCGNGCDSAKRECEQQHHHFLVAGQRSSNAMFSVSTFTRGSPRKPN